jgi:hypothetical protein
MRPIRLAAALQTIKEPTMRHSAVAAALGLALATAVATAPAVAAVRDPVVNFRQHQQHLRIHQGATSGALTAGEVRRLAAEQRAIRLQERVYKRDGILSSWERRDLARDQNAASRHIFREAHDAQVRW